ncbi:MAG: hypothetical protein IJX12_07865 [Lachnospiraceae bacterium]|nr:hypothetical protein [Lachnospiraceae bacterium]
MVENFYEDLAAAKKAEAIVLEVLRNTGTKDYEFDDVSDDPEFFHRGDIEVWDDTWGYHLYVDVKDDGCVSSTGNILAEHRVWYADSGYQKGFMQNSSYDYVAYVSQPDNKIYMLDFNLWRKYYKTNFKRHIEIPHYKYGRKTQATDAYLMPLKTAKELCIMVAEIDYKKESNGKHIPVKIKTY